MSIHINKSADEHAEERRLREAARRILGGGPPKVDPRDHFDGCPARDGKPICNCGGHRAHEGNTAPLKPAMNQLTLSHVVKDLIRFHTMEWADEIYEDGLNKIMAKLAPLLEAAEWARDALPRFTQESTICVNMSYNQERIIGAKQSFDQARSALLPVVGGEKS